MKVSLIATVLNGADHVDAFLGSIAMQTRPPDEIVIVDGGSNDGTLERIRSAQAVTVIEEPGANIARGRNRAIAEATFNAIAVADADCTYDPTWLEEIVKPIEAGADVAMGFFLADADGFFQDCMASVNLPLDASEVDPDRYMPSARSVAFRRSAIDSVGGYPEWLEIGEDMWVNHRWRELGLDLRFAPDAVARWRLRPGPTATWGQYFQYARGDAHARMYPERHALRFAVYGGLVAALVSRRRWPKVLAMAAAIYHARAPVRRARRRLQDPRERALAFAVVPALMGWTDVAKMVGYVVGLVDRATGMVRERRLSPPGFPPAAKGSRGDPW